MSALPPKSRHYRTPLPCPLSAKSGLMQCSTNPVSTARGTVFSLDYASAGQRRDQ